MYVSFLYGETNEILKLNRTMRAEKYLSKALGQKKIVVAWAPQEVYENLKSFIPSIDLLIPYSVGGTCVQALQSSFDCGNRFHLLF